MSDGKVDLFVFESTGRTVQHKLNAQYLRLIGLHRDVNDAHRAGANRLRKKTKQKSPNQENVAEGLQEIGGDQPFQSRFKRFGY